MLSFSGPNGEAVLRIDPAPSAETRDLIRKAKLMATALAAEACVWIFEASLETAGGGRQRVVAALGEDRGGSRMLLAAIEDADGPRLRRVATRLDPAAGTDRAPPLRHFIRRDQRDNDPLEAWRRLEAMGVNLTDSRRPLH
jgi:hypothetical protein